MSVNYTLADLQEALENHPFGLTQDENWKYEHYIQDWWESNVYSDELQPLHELVEEFLKWLADGENEFVNKKNFKKSLED